MTVRSILWALLPAMFIGNCGVADTPGDVDVAQPPNIIYVMLDDAGYGDFGAFGSTAIQTPTFDQMCREGMRFDHHYSGSAVCAPTRCVLMTGLHTGHCKRRDNKTTAFSNELSHNGLVFLGPDDVTVADAMQAAGYVTGGIGKWGLGNSDTLGAPDKHGFYHFLGYLDQVHAHDHFTDWLWNDGKRMELSKNTRGQKGTYVHDVLESDTLAFIKEHANQDNPFFLYLPYTLPHGKYEIPHETEAFQMYAEEKWSQQTKEYAAMVTRADETVGKIMDLLKELKVDDNTVVFYTSDNGPNAPFAKEINSGGSLRGIKRQLTEGGLRAAMVARWPGKIPAGKTSDFAWSMIDVFPTCCDLANFDPVHVLKQTKLDGISVLPTLLGKPQAAIPSIYFEIHHPFQQAVRMDHWKGFRTGTQEPLKLFNLMTDPKESTDVASENPKVVQAIESIMKAEHVESRFYPSLEKAKPKRKRNQKSN